jgi:very-short-patch-repair endonuclease
MKQPKWNPEDIRRLYWEENLSTTAIAKAVGSGGGAPAIIRFMQRHGIPRRTNAEGISLSWQGADDRRAWAAANLRHQSVAHYEKGVATRADQYRNKPNQWERAAIEYLTTKKVAFQFQVAFNVYIADFVLPERMLIIEIDSLHHRMPHIAARDQRRTEYLEGLGYTVRRVNVQAERAMSTFHSHLDACLE